MHLLVEILRNSILITGLVVIMMMMIESLNIESKGLIFKGLRKTHIGQVIIAALLGSIPGCMGGFAAVSLYTHRIFSFGALIAMMIASSGDEAFVMLAMIPDQALILFVILFILAIIVGVITDIVNDRIHRKRCNALDHSECGVKSECNDGYVIHEEEHILQEHEHRTVTSDRQASRHFGWRRIVMFVGLAIFIAALAGGQLGHDHNTHDHSECFHHGHDHHETTHDETGNTFTINLLDEQWMNILFAGLSVIILIVLIFASDHFVEDHLWNHVVKRHLPTIFAWTFGVLLVLGIGLQHIEIDRWISDNTVLMILLATAIGIIPESGPHLIFVTLFAAGVVPFPVLLASSISQDGHSSIPLLAESKKSFLWAKAINCLTALAAGLIAMLVM